MVLSVLLRQPVWPAPVEVHDDPMATSVRMSLLTVKHA